MTAAHLSRAGLAGRKLTGLRRDLTVGIKECAPDTRRAASRAVALAAVDRADCRQLLDMLGLLEDSA